MSKNTTAPEAVAAPDKTVTIDGDTHEILRIESFNSGGETIKSLIATAVREKYGKGKK